MAITYAPRSADFLVYCNPKLVSHYSVFVATLISLSISFSFCFMLGIGLSSSLNNDLEWATVSVGLGALVVVGFDSLGTFSKFYSIIAALGLIANLATLIYSSGIDF
jgi:purine-cytosine permease-like protein